MQSYWPPSAVLILNGFHRPRMKKQWSKKLSNANAVRSNSNMQRLSKSCAQIRRSSRLMQEVRRVSKTIILDLKLECKVWWTAQDNLRCLQSKMLAVSSWCPSTHRWLKNQTKRIMIWVRKIKEKSTKRGWGSTTVRFGSKKLLFPGNAILSAPKIPSSSTQTDLEQVSISNPFIISHIFVFLAQKIDQMFRKNVQS